MGKGKRIEAKRKANDFLPHAQEVLTRNFQKQIRNSELWPQMVAEFGEKKAEELLKQCQGELRPGFLPDEAGNRPTHF
jgi:hypothetical protein